MCEWVSVCAWRCIFDVYPKSKLLYARTFDPGWYCYYIVIHNIDTKVWNQHLFCWRRWRSIRHSIFWSFCVNYWWDWNPDGFQMQAIKQLAAFDRDLSTISFARRHAGSSSQRFFWMKSHWSEKHTRLKCQTSLGGLLLIFLHLCRKYWTILVDIYIYIQTWFDCKTLNVLPILCVQIFHGIPWEESLMFRRLEMRCWAQERKEFCRYDERGGFTRSLYE